MWQRAALQQRRVEENTGEESMNYLVVDIETAPDRHEEYAAHWPKSKKKPSLHAIISQVVCIGLSDNGQKSVIDRQEHDSEKDMLRWFNDVLREHKNDDFVTFNGKAFDCPFLQIRAAKYGIHMALPDKRALRNKDIYEAIGGKWQSEVSSCSLSELTWFLFGAGKDHNGGEVADWWEKGELATIAKYCLSDVEWTERIYRDYGSAWW